MQKATFQLFLEELNKNTFDNSLKNVYEKCSHWEPSDELASCQIVTLDNLTHFDWISRALEETATNCLNFIANSSIDGRMILKEIISSLTLDQASLKLNLNNALSLSISKSVLCLFMISNHPDVAAKKQLENYLWKNNAYYIIQEIKKLVTTSQSNNRLHKSLKKLYFDYINILETIFMETIFHILRKISTCDFTPKTETIYAFWISSLFTLMADCERYNSSGETEILLDVSTQRNLVMDELYRLSAIINPSNGRSFHQLAICASLRNDLLDSIYNFIRSYSSLQDPFSSSNLDLGPFCKQLSFNCKKLLEKVVSHKNIKLISLLDVISEEPCNLILTKSNNREMISLIANLKQCYSAENIIHPTLFYNKVNSGEIKTELFKMMMKLCLSQFLYFNVQIIVRTNLDQLSNTLSEFLIFLKYLLFNSNSSINLSAYHTLRHVVISIFSIEHCLHYLNDNFENGNPVRDVLALDLSLLFLSSYISVMIDHLEYINDLDDDRSLMPLVAISVFLSWLRDALQRQNCLKSMIFKQIPNTYMLKIIKLSKIIKPDIQQNLFTFQDPVERIIPKFRFFHIFSKQQNIYEKINFNSWISDVVVTNQELVISIQIKLFEIYKLGVLPLKCKNNEWIFDYESFISHQKLSSLDPLRIHNIETIASENYLTQYESFKEFFSEFDDLKITLIAFHYCMFLRKVPSLTVDVIKIIVPDTNCFMSFPKIMKRLFASRNITIAIPVVVISELRGLSIGKTKPSLENSRRVNEAKESLKIIDENMDNQNMELLTNQGNLIPFSLFSTVDPRDAIDKNDDLILNSVLILKDKNLRSAKIGSLSVVKNSVIFLTGDVILKTKASSEDILCLKPNHISNILLLE